MRDASLLSTGTRAEFHRFSLLANQQFIESRVYEEADGANPRPDADSSNPRPADLSPRGLDALRAASVHRAFAAIQARSAPRGLPPQPRAHHLSSHRPVPSGPSQGRWHVPPPSADPGARPYLPVLDGAPYWRPLPHLFATDAYLTDPAMGLDAPPPKPTGHALAPSGSALPPASAFSAAAGGGAADNDDYDSDTESSVLTETESSSELTAESSELTDSDASRRGGGSVSVRAPVRMSVCPSAPCRCPPGCPHLPAQL